LGLRKIYPERKKGSDVRCGVVILDAGNASNKPTSASRVRNTTQSTKKTTAQLKTHQIKSPRKIIKYQKYVEDLPEIDTVF
jgi:hypothetical protein